MAHKVVAWNFMKEIKAGAEAAKAEATKAGEQAAVPGIKALPI